MMNKRVFILLLNVFLCGAVANAQVEQAQKSEQQSMGSRSSFIHAFESYARQGKIQQSVENGIKAVQLYYQDNGYKEAFELLHLVEQTITSAKEEDNSVKASLRYQVSKERMQMYMRLRKSDRVKDQIELMERFAGASGDEGLKNDLLYNKAIYYYTFGQTVQGNAVFKEMAGKLTASKEYDKVDAAYQTLITNGRKSNNANLVAQAYTSYIAWKDSANALKVADEIGALKQQITDNEASIAEKDNLLSTRWMIIIGLCVLLVALAAALVVGGIVLLRFILLTRKQKKTIKLANENNALKAKFIGNISAQLEPTLKKLNSGIPEVRALMDFSAHIQTLSELENTSGDSVELEETQIPPFCEALMNGIRDKVKSNVTLTVNAPKMSARINREYVSHILSHLLHNAAEYTPEGGSIWLDYKKRGAHTHQFLVSDTGAGVPEEKREDVFKAFREVRDLTQGDGLGLPICKQMAMKMKGDLDIDASFTRGTRFVLELHD